MVVRVHGCWACVGNGQSVPSPCLWGKVLSLFSPHDSTCTQLPTRSTICNISSIQLKHKDKRAKTSSQTNALFFPHLLRHEILPPETVLTQYWFNMSKF